MMESENKHFTTISVFFEVIVPEQTKILGEEIKKIA